mmetsp:Transcript_46190/g.81923  ORF Transcript_46190/g.81923 Transcript_46190/m.81923 type:complete len:102 (+) Transcript_46190:228-533(+)
MPRQAGAILHAPLLFSRVDASLPSPKADRAPQRQQTSSMQASATRFTTENAIMMPPTTSSWSPYVISLNRKILSMHTDMDLELDLCHWRSPQHCCQGQGGQ